MKIRFCLTIIFTGLFLSAFAQENNMREIYSIAEENYGIGRIEQAKELLVDNINSFPENLKEGAYKLLSLCHLALDEPESAEKYTSLLLNISPYYSPSPQDPQRFIDLVNNIKLGRGATITTASSQAETLSEVPVPITLITEEMIHNSGARNLQEVLAAYVPGLHIVDCNDDINIAMRGIYSNGQEKILIMLNGHRLNSYCTNIASPDFSISLEKLKQIEVLRGPASSLYGGVALTGVVNLITKRGIDLDGVEIKAGIGNHDQLKADILFGKKYFDLDLIVWGSIYKNNGEEKDTPKDQTFYKKPNINKVTVGKIGNKPSYDFGVQLKWKNLQFLYDTHFSQVAAPYTISTFGAPYDRSSYRTFNGISPSFSTNSHHADLSYQHQWNKLTLKGNVTYDNSNLTHYQVLSDLAMPELYNIMSLPESYKDIFNKGGIARYINGQEQTYGAQIKGDYNYIEENGHNGYLTFGLEYSHFQLEDVRYQTVYDFTSASPESPVLQELGKGHEDNYNGFIQLKHKWNSFVFNAGLRYDHKRRYDDSRVNELSPRIAFIYIKPKWNVKLSYSRSFVDAPYLYRKTNNFLTEFNKDSNYKNKRELYPESAKSFQATFSGTEWFKGFNFEVNAFYNNADNLIITHTIDYVNEGKNKTMGIELMANYKRPKFTADLTFTWLKTFETTIYSTNIDSNNNTPALMSHIVLSWNPIKPLKLNSHIILEGKQTSYNSDFVKMLRLSKELNDLDEQFRKGTITEQEYILGIVKATELLDDTVLTNNMKARAIFNLGASYNLGKCTLGFNCYNIFNTTYERSGMNTVLIPQKGRWFMFDISYKF